MRLVTTFRVALRSLRANKLRSLLAMLGIIIGIAAVISMLAIGAGAEEQIMSRISAMGTNLLSVRPGQGYFRGVSSGAVETLTLDDAMALLHEIDSIMAVSPEASSNAQLKFFENNMNASVYGVAITWPSIRNYEVEYGRFFTESEVESRMRVVVIGSEIAEELGINQGSLNEYIKLKGIRFKLIGILKSKGGGWGSSDNRALIPYTTAMGTVFGLDYLTGISIQTADNTEIDRIEEEITSLLQTRHGIESVDEIDFRVFNQAEILETASDASKTFTVLLGAIASISLIVGGIGIMNIMLVTVTERTREIGIRKAIGAKGKDILLQFLLEAIILCIISGIIGVAVGVGASNLIGKMSEYTTSLQMSGIILALTFSMTVGIFFGYYPARRAALLDPVDALSYE
ncbi:ABC transporter permease [bacterium]|nr:ABC transporter permease [bacterium]